MPAAVRHRGRECPAEVAGSPGDRRGSREVGVDDLAEREGRDTPAAVSEPVDHCETPARRGVGPGLDHHGHRPGTVTDEDADGAVGRTADADEHAGLAAGLDGVGDQLADDDGSVVHQLV